LTSIYLLIFSTVAMVAAALSRPRDWLGRRFVPAAACLALAAGISVIALWPYLQPYWQVHREHRVARTLIDIEMYSASWKDYLSTPSRIHFNTWSARWFTGAALFPGLLATALAAFAVVRGIVWRDLRARMCLAVGISGAILSLGSNLPGYETLFQIVLPLQAVRAVSRFGYLATLAIAFLAAFGLAALQRQITPRWWPAVAVAILTALALEPLVAPIEFRRFAGVSPIYESIELEPGAVVVELPMPGGTRWFGNASYMLNSTRHWRPMLNGYSGFAPVSFHEHAARLETFPDDAAIAALETLGVTHAFVHVNGYTAQQLAGIGASPRLTRAAADEFVVLYRVNATRGRY
jgi:hypothetical protein